MTKRIPMQHTITFRGRARRFIGIRLASKFTKPDAMLVIAYWGQCLGEVWEIDGEESLEELRRYYLTVGPSEKVTLRRVQSTEYFSNTKTA